VAYRRGSVTEVLEDGVTGFIVPDVAAAARAVKRIDRLDRARVRHEFDRRFSARRMALDYLDVYAGVREGRSSDAYAGRS